MAYRWPALAIEGGPKAKPTKYHKGNRYGKAEVKEVTEALASGQLGGLGGEKIQKMCADFCAYTGAKHTRGVSSGTAAVHTALGALGIRPGDEVITTPVTDFGTIIGILYQNAIPIFADLQPHTYNLDPASVEAAITPKTAAIVAVHLGGNPCDMDALRRIAKKHHLALVEDCAQAVGARWRGRHVGTLGDVGCFSLNYSKHISVGHGGLVTTNDAALADRLQRFADKNYGQLERDRILGMLIIPQLAPGYRLGELEAAVAIAQIRKLPRIIRKHIAIGETYGRGVADIPGVYPHEVLPHGESSWWLYIFRLNEKLMGCTRDEFLDTLRAEGVRTRRGYVPTPVYTWQILREQTVYPGTKCPFDCKHARKGIVYKKGMCPETERILADDVFLDVNQFFSAADVRETVYGVRKVAAHFLAKQGIRLEPKGH